MRAFDFVHQRAGEREEPDIVQAEQARAQAIVDVVRVIGDVVGDRGRLRLEARESMELERMAPDIIENGEGNAAFAIALERPTLGADQGAVVLDQTLERLLAEIEPVEV